MRTAISLRGVVGDWVQPIPDISASRYYLRCLWIIVRLTTAYWFANEASPFFYQQF
jgi:hypothetical protein